MISTIKYKSKLIKESLQWKKIKNILEWCKQGPALHPTKNLWNDLKRAMHWRFYKDEWTKIAKSRCAKLADSFPETLLYYKENVLWQCISYGDIYAIFLLLLKWYYMIFLEFYCLLYHIKGEKWSEIIYIHTCSQSLKKTNQKLLRWKILKYFCHHLARPVALHYLLNFHIISKKGWERTDFILAQCHA